MAEGGKGLENKGLTILMACAGEQNEIATT
jgi:hypothetical protein